MNFEDVLSEGSQSQKVSYRVIPFIQKVQDGKTHRHSKETAGGQELGDGLAGSGEGLPMGIGWFLGW